MKQWYNMSDLVVGIPVIRYIASWYIAGGKPQIKKIERWLRSLVIDGEPLSDEEVVCLTECILCGKLELQESAKRFV